MGKSFRCLSYALVGIALMLVTAQTALAHRDPPTSTSTGVSISITAFRADQITPIGGGAVNECETIYYQATLGPAPGAAAIEGGTLSIVTPDGTPHDVTPVTGIPCLGGTINDPVGTIGQCAGSPPNLLSAMVLYQSSFAAGTCTATSVLIANVIYLNGRAHNGTTDQLGVGAQTPFQSPVVCCTDDGPVCNGVVSCDPAAVDGVHLGSCVESPDVLCPDDGLVCNGPEACSETSVPPGQCVHGPPAEFSTACIDSDGNACNTAGCDGAGLCDQLHVVKSCADDGEVCNGPEICNTTSGDCQSGPPAEFSTACIDSDGNACNTAGCDGAGLCDQLHVVKSCADNGDSCDGPETCDTTSGDCVSGPPPPPCADPVCEICDPTTVDGSCIPRDPLPAECVPSEEICRTPGFWGTHGGIEKGGPNITQAVLNQTGPINICGHLISTTDLSNTSAIEAICSSPKGDSTIQLARQLTAAALNCGLTNSTSCGTPPTNGQTVGNVCNGVSIEDTFNTCNALCADPTATQADISACIGAIDCFNNGGTAFDSLTDICSGSSGCHERDLVNGCFNFPNPGPASSPKKCNDARKDDCSIFCSVPCTNLVACTD